MRATRWEPRPHGTGRGKGMRFGVGVLDRRPPLCNPLDGRLCHAISCFTHPRNEDNAQFTELFWASKGSFQVLFARKLLRKLGDINDYQGILTRSSVFLGAAELTLDAC